MIKGSVTAKAGAFAAAVKWTAKFLAARPSVPIQAGLLLSIDGGRLSILGYNETTTARAVVEVEGSGTGQVVVSGRLLAELAGTFPAKPVTIEGFGDDVESIAIAVGSWRGTLPVMRASEFPSPPPAPSVMGTVSGDALTAMIRRVAAARSDSPEAALRWHLMHLTFGDGSIVAMGTDSYRAAYEVVAYNGTRGSALVHAGEMLGVAEAFAGPDDVHIGLSDSAIGLASPTRAVILRQAGDAEYPLLQIQGLFKVTHPEHAQVAVADLQGPLKRAVIMRDGKQSIMVRFGAGLIALAAESEIERRAGEEEVSATYTGAPWTLRFNPGYFADALASAPGDTVDINLTTEKVSGIVLTVPGNDAWRHLLMPIKK
jgi:DNA polymerase-3 subunit beta